MKTLTIFNDGGYSLKEFWPGRGWDIICAVFFSPPKHETEKMKAWALTQGIAVTDLRAA